MVVSDIMEDNSVLDSGGGSSDGRASVELFASDGALNFPIEPVTEAWKEKVFCLCYVEIRIYYGLHS